MQVDTRLEVDGIREEEGEGEEGVVVVASDRLLALLLLVRYVLVERNGDQKQAKNPRPEGQSKRQKAKPKERHEKKAVATHVPDDQQKIIGDV